MIVWGLPTIASEFNCTPKKMKALIDLGAPVISVQEGRTTRYHAELERLREWKDRFVSGKLK